MTSTPRDRDDDGGVDVEAAWADIVAHWDTDRPVVGPWPASEDTDDSGEGPGEEWDDVPSHVGGEAARHAAAAPEPEDEEEGYVPPEPPPLPRGDLVTTLSWAGVLGSPLFFLLTALFWRSVPQVLILVAIGAFVAGFVSLVLRMPSRRDPDDDDGAVV